MTKLQKTWSNTKDYSISGFTVVMILFLIFIVVFYFWRRMNLGGIARVGGLRVGSVSKRLGRVRGAMREKGIAGGLLSAASGSRRSSGMNGRGRYTTLSDRES